MPYYPYAPSASNNRANERTRGDSSSASAAGGSGTHHPSSNSNQLDEESLALLRSHQQNRKTRTKQPADKPKRPLSAYNLFFKDERAKLLEEIQKEQEKEDQKTAASGKLVHAKKSAGVGFAKMAQTISTRWKAIDEPTLAIYKELADKDMVRYRNEMLRYHEKQRLESDRQKLIKAEEEAERSAHQRQIHSSNPPAPSSSNGNPSDGGATTGGTDPVEPKESTSKDERGKVESGKSHPDQQPSSD